MSKNYKKLFGAVVVVAVAVAQYFFATNGWAAAPAAPTMTVSASGLTVTVSWSAVTGATSYTLYYAPYPYTGAASIRNVAMGTQTSLSATLREGAAYYVAVKASNADGSSGYSNIEHFTVTAANAGGSTVTDVDGNVYNTVTIGTQTWMKENLKVTKYRDGTAIPTGAGVDPSTEASPKYQWAYDNNEEYVSTYGRLYTWYAATDSRGLCPSGWHLPTETEWTTLTTYLGGVDSTDAYGDTTTTVAGGHMKETGMSHWNGGYANIDADNSSGFTALPGGGTGVRCVFGSCQQSFGGMNSVARWWSATESATGTARRRIMLRDANGNAYRQSDAGYQGSNVRCLKD